MLQQSMLSKCPKVGSKPHGHSEVWVSLEGLKPWGPAAEDPVFEMCHGHSRHRLFSQKGKGMIILPLIENNIPII